MKSLMDHVFDLDQFSLVFSYVAHALLSLVLIAIIILVGVAIFYRAK